MVVLVLQDCACSAVIPDHISWGHLRSRWSPSASQGGSTRTPPEALHERKHITVLRDRLSAPDRRTRFTQFLLARPCSVARGTTTLLVVARHHLAHVAAGSQAALATAVTQHRGHSIPVKESGPTERMLHVQWSKDEKRIHEEMYGDPRL